MKIVGIVHKIGATTTIPAKTEGAQDFSFREVVLQCHRDRRDDFITFRFVRDRVSLIDPYKEGEEVQISFDLRGRLLPATADKPEACVFNLEAYRVDPYTPRQ